MTVRIVILMVDISMVNDLVNVDINMAMTNIPMGGTIIVNHEKVGFPEGRAGSSKTNSPSG
jgi:hypothetical protein